MRLCANLVAKANKSKYKINNCKVFSMGKQLSDYLLNYYLFLFCRSLNKVI